MKKIAVFAVIATLLLILCSTSYTAPSLQVTKPPVTPAPSWTGPTMDPHAAQGQWFYNLNTGKEEVRTHEFYDNVIEFGGGYASHDAIRGVVTNVLYAGGPGSNILFFEVDVTIKNDAPATSDWNNGSNSHGESLAVQSQYQGALLRTKLAASFAVSNEDTVPDLWAFPYRPTDPYIVAENEDQLAWYCWTPDNPIQKTPWGWFYVPTWDFGDIPPGEIANRKLSFTIPAPGLPPTDPRYGAIVQSLQENKDILCNRSSSLKISNWIDDVALDTGTPYPQAPIRASDVSVFHDAEPAVELDWGDAPDPTYPTLSTSLGASHIAVGPMLGKYRDIEADGQQHPQAMKDDFTGAPDDEDGVTFPSPLIIGRSTVVEVEVSGGTTLDAWMDFNCDGDWNEANEHIYAGVSLLPGLNTLPLLIPADAADRPTFARFRVALNGISTYTGQAPNGEVEDYMVTLRKAPTLAFAPNVHIPDHFWYPNPDPYNEMISLTAFAGPAEGVVWNNITLQAAGNGDDAADIASVDVWLDNNNTGRVELPGDVLIGSGTYPVDNGVLTVPITISPIPPSGLIKIVISYKMLATSVPGTTFEFTALTASATGQATGAPADVFGLPRISARKIAAVRPITIGKSKNLGVGTLCFLENKEITADFLQPTFPVPWNWFYMEERDRSSGIGVIGWLTGPLNVGDTVSVLGTTVISHGTELMISPMFVLKSTSSPTVTSLGMNNKWTGGGPFGEQSGALDDAWTGTASHGLNNVGMLIRTWGEVTGRGTMNIGPGHVVDVVWINDGSMLKDGGTTSTGDPSLGVAVAIPPGMGVPPSIGTYWGVTGIMKAIPNPLMAPGTAVRLLVPRNSAIDMDKLH